MTTIVIAFIYGGVAENMLMTALHCYLLLWFYCNEEGDNKLSSPSSLCLRRRRWSLVVISLCGSVVEKKKATLRCRLLLLSYCNKKRLPSPFFFAFEKKNKTTMRHRLPL
jgi:hypothetical protein